jgi:hypothetical protein
MQVKRFIRSFCEDCEAWTPILSVRVLGGALLGLEKVSWKKKKYCRDKLFLLPSTQHSRIFKCSGSPPAFEGLAYRLTHMSRLGFLLGIPTTT